MKTAISAGLALSMLVPASALLFAVHREFDKTLLENVSSSLDRQTALIGLGIERALLNEMTEARFISQSDSLEGNDAAKITQYIEEIARESEFISAIGVYSLDGALITATAPAGRLPGSLQALEPALPDITSAIAAARQSEVFVSDATRGDGDPVVYLATPITDDSNLQVIKALVIQVDLNAFVPLLAEFEGRVTGSQRMFMLDNDGLAIASTDPDQPQFEPFIYLTEMEGFGAPQGNTLFTSRQGQEFVASHHEALVPNQGETLRWQLVAVALLDEVYSPLESLRNQVFVIVGIALISALAIGGFLSARLLGRVRRLTRIVHQMPELDEESLPPSGGLQEFQTLENAMVESSRKMRELDRRRVILGHILEHVPVMIAYNNPDGTVDYVNPEYERVFGWNLEEIRNHPDFFAASTPNPEQKKRVIEFIKAGEGAFEEFDIRNRGGQIIPVTFANFRLADGTSIGIGLDLTERRLGEAQRRQIERMDAVGKLTGGIAHDFNNILGIAMGNLEILTRRLKEDPDSLHHADAAIEAVERGSALTRRLLGFSRSTARESRTVDVNAFLSSLESLIKTSMTPAIIVVMELGDHLWNAECDPGDLENAIINLCINARDAMPHGGKLVIETANKVIDEHYVMQSPGSRMGDYVMINISDNGRGMPKEVREHAFDPFFTTKAEGKGSGLGLSTVYGFALRSGGHVKIYSEPGVGTSVRLYLPRSLGSTEKAVEPPLEMQEFAGGDETILLVDDEEGLIEVTGKSLRSLGYRVLTAAGPDEALALLKQDIDIDLMFSDVVMAGEVDGYRLAIEAMKLRPALRVLLTSGFTQQREIFTNGEKEAYQKLAANLLNKPYRFVELATRIRRYLDQP